MNLSAEIAGIKQFQIRNGTAVFREKRPLHDLHQISGCILLFCHTGNACVEDHLGTQLSGPCLYIPPMADHKLVHDGVIEDMALYDIRT